MVTDHELENGEEWFYVMQDLPDIEPDPLFDDAGDYKHVHHVTETMIDINLLKTQVFDYQDLLFLHNQNVIPSMADYS